MSRRALAIPARDASRTWTQWITLWCRIGEVDVSLLERHSSSTVSTASPRQRGLQRATALPDSFQSLAAAAAKAAEAEQRAQIRICGLRLKFGRRATLLVTLMLVALAIDVAGLLPALTFPLWVWGVGAAVSEGGWSTNSAVTILEGAVTSFWHLAIMWMLFGDFARSRLLLGIDAALILGVFVPFRAACEVLYAGQTPTGLRVVGNVVSIAVQLTNSVLLARFFHSLGPASEFAEMFMYDDSGNFGITLNRASHAPVAAKAAAEGASQLPVLTTLSAEEANRHTPANMSTRASLPAVHLSHVLTNANSDRRMAWRQQTRAGGVGDSPVTFVTNPMPAAAAAVAATCSDEVDAALGDAVEADADSRPLDAHWLDLDAFCCCCCNACARGCWCRPRRESTAAPSNDSSAAGRADGRAFPSTWRIIAILMLPFISAFVTAWLFIFVIVPIMFAGSSSPLLRVAAAAVATPLWFAANRAFLRIACIQLLHGNQSATWVGLYLLGAQSILLTRLFNATNDTLAEQVRSTAAVVGVQLIGRLTVKLQHAMAAQIGRLKSPFAIDMLSFRLPSRSLWVLAQSIVLIQMVQFSMVGVMNFTAFYVKASKLGMPPQEAVTNGVALSVIQVALDIPACIVAMMFEEWSGIPVVQAFRERWRTLIIVVFVNGAFITWFAREYLPGLMLLVLGRAAEAV